MNYKIRTVILSIAFLLRPEFALAVNPDFNPPPPPPPAPAPAPAPTSTINIGSHVGQNSQNSGAGANNAAGAALIAAGTALLPNPPTTAQGAMLIALGILALAQGSHDDNAAGQSGNTGAASALREAPVKPSPSPYANGDGGFNDPLAKKALASIQGLGYDVTSKGIKLPDGSTISTSSLSSASGLKSAGIDPEVLKKVADINKTIAQDYRVSSVALADGGGGGGAHDIGNGGAVDLSDEGNAKKFNPFALGEAAKAALLAGKTVTLGGDPIGVAGANIFEMIHDAYQKKRTGDQFMESEEEAARARKPASVAPVKNK